MPTPLRALWTYYHGLGGISAAVRRGSLYPEDLLDLSLAEIAASDQRIHAFTTVHPQLPARPPTGTLAGIPVAVKDNIDVRWLPTSLGLSPQTRPPGARVPARTDASAVRALRASGVTIVGKTNLPEYATSAVGLNPTFGHVANPGDLTRTAGGSSGGSAAAVAAGMVLAALGTDTAGSVLIPAALTGIFGFRPSAGTLSARGVKRLSPSLDTVGFLGLSAADLSLMASVAGRPGHRARGGRSGGGPSGPLRVGALAGWFANVDDDVDQAMRHALSTWAGNGVAIASLTLDQVDEVSDSARTVYAHETAVSLGAALDPGTRYSATVEARRRSDVSTAELAAAERTRKRWRDRVKAAFAEFDVLTMPTVPMVAPLIGADIETTASRLVHQTYPIAFAGLPAVSIPLPADGGLPKGALIVTAPGTDLTALAVADELSSLLHSDSRHRARAPSRLEAGTSE
jgi:Asp-tRNA(Asn)/Glu-tRNA(Gln) amidotransferase A subunit family amidase